MIIHNLFNLSKKNAEIQISTKSLRKLKIEPHFSVFLFFGRLHILWTKRNEY